MKKEAYDVANDLPVDSIVVNDLCHGVVELEYQEQAGKVECGRQGPWYAPGPEEQELVIEMKIVEFTENWTSSICKH